MRIVPPDMTIEKLMRNHVGLLPCLKRNAEVLRKLLEHHMDWEPGLQILLRRQNELLTNRWEYLVHQPPRYHPALGEAERRALASEMEYVAEQARIHLQTLEMLHLANFEGRVDIMLARPWRDPKSPLYTPRPPRPVPGPDFA